MASHPDDVASSVSQLTEQIEGYLSRWDSLDFKSGPIGMFARIKAKPGRTIEIIREIRKFEAIVRRRRTRCVTTYLSDAVDDRLVYVTQLYADRAALTQHIRDPGLLTSMNAILNASDGPPAYRFAQPDSSSGSSDLSP